MSRTHGVLGLSLGLFLPKLLCVYFLKAIYAQPLYDSGRVFLRGLSLSDAKPPSAIPHLYSAVLFPRSYPDHLRLFGWTYSLSEEYLLRCLPTATACTHTEGLVLHRCCPFFLVFRLSNNIGLKKTC
ncbi:hypothetical protein GQ54DRAFT_115803 [Martensiomyces pterosporus]|nr:hypothetical protein GQ54DRAFT_115803 [Martensiomyces pterosporus]